MIGFWPTATVLAVDCLPIGSVLPRCWQTSAKAHGRAEK